MKSLVIIPTYNERENLPSLVSAVLEKIPSLDVLVIDDGSPDGTGEMADWLARKSGRVRVIHRPGKQGLGTAYVAGFEFALREGYERVVQMDADFSHRPEDLPFLLQAAESADVVIGSRNVPGGDVVDWVSTRAGNRGRADVYIDGVKAATVDLYASSAQHRRVVFSKSLAPGEHTLQIRTLGTKNAASSGRRVDVDAFVVML